MNAPLRGAPEVGSENPTPEAKPDEDWEIKSEPDIAEKVRRAVPVSDYAKRLEQIHAQEGRRAEVGELSPTKPRKWLT
jgi:hypothetical protein